MKKNLLIVSIVANVALAALLILRVGEAPAVDPGAGGVEVVTNTVTRRVAGPVEVVNSTNVVRLDWAVLESSDYEEYIKNLRGVGCPEETIRDIIIADVNKLFAARWRESQPASQSWQYWRLTPKGAGKDPVTGQLRLALEGERSALIYKLLGVDLKSELSKYEWNASSRRDDDLAYLSAGNRLWVEDWEKRSKLELRQLTEQLKSSNEPKESRAAFMRDLESRQQRDLAKALTPGELAEYQARHSALADQLRKYLDPIEPTETEFRKMVALIGSQSGAMLSSARLKGGDSPLNDPFLQPRVQEILGVERYSMFQRAIQPPEKADLGTTEEQVTAKLVLQQIADEEIAKITSNPRLTPEDRDALIRQIEKERKRMSTEFKKGGRKVKKR